MQCSNRLLSPLLLSCIAPRESYVLGDYVALPRTVNPCQLPDGKYSACSRFSHHVSYHRKCHSTFSIKAADNFSANAGALTTPLSPKTPDDIHPNAGILGQDTHKQLLHEGDIVLGGSRGDLHVDRAN